MREEYDFSGAEQGKFYTPLEQIEMPVYLDSSVLQHYKKQASQRKIALGDLVNEVLKSQMDKTGS